MDSSAIQQEKEKPHAEFKNQLEDIEIPLIDIKVKVDTYNAELLFDGAWGGIRTGLTLRFWF